VRKLVLATVAALTVLAALSTTAFAAPANKVAPAVGPFDGRFKGTVYGHNGSAAPLTLDLAHNDDLVQGNLVLGSGLYVKGGICGGAYVPAAAQYASGKTVKGDPSRLVASTKVDVGRFDITVKLDGNVSADGQAITARAKLDLPWFCGGDPVLNATLYKTN
jgi:hypothetical protein